jgi:high affinity Mn2+ porin
LGLNWEQEIAKNVGLFSRLGWNDGHEEAWTYTEVNWSASLGASVKGPLRDLPKRQDDVFGLAGIVSGASSDQRAFLAAGGLGILDGDGALSYSAEKVLETYYAFQLDKSFQLMLDYQFVADPAFNSARGPVSIFGARVHWEY